MLLNVLQLAPDGGLVQSGLSAFVVCSPHGHLHVVCQSTRELWSVAPGSVCSTAPARCSQVMIGVNSSIVPVKSGPYNIVNNCFELKLPPE